MSTRRYTADEMLAMANGFADPQGFPVIADMLRQAEATEAKVMELVEALTLISSMRADPLPIEWSSDIAREALSRFRGES